MTITPRPELGVLPPRIAALPIDARGYPVPWFVEWRDGVPEFRVMDGRKLADAVRFRLCWVCGGKLGRHLAFVVGPMCGINRTSSEPPCHYDCAIWSATHCPFLTRPHMRRREDDEINASLGGEASLARNPGVTLVWFTRTYTPFRVDPVLAPTGVLFEMGDPDHVAWLAEGRPATRAEVLASIESGLPALVAACAKERTVLDQQDARRELAARTAAFSSLLPDDGETVPPPG